MTAVLIQIREPTMDDPDQLLKDFKTRFEEEALSDPQRAFNSLFDDLCLQMRKRGVSDDAIEGMQIGLMIAFRLGEANVRKEG